MRALLVVEVHGLVDEQAGLGQVIGEHEEEFVFEDAVDPLGQRVLVAVGAVGHRAAQLRLAQGRLVGIGGVLAAAVGVVDGADGGPAGPAHGPVQGGQAAGGVQAGMDVVADDAPGKGIGDQAQVDGALPGGQIGDIADPQLVGGRRFGGVLDPVGVAVEAVVRIRGLGIAALGRNEQPLPTQQAEQGVAAARHALHPQERRDFMAPLARAQARQLGPHRPHLHQDLLVACGLPGLALAALVEALPAHAVELAAALHA